MMNNINIHNDLMGYLKSSIENFDIINNEYKDMINKSVTSDERIYDFMDRTDSILENWEFIMDNLNINDKNYTKIFKIYNNINSFNSILKKENYYSKLKSSENKENSTEEKSISVEFNDLKNLIESEIEIIKNKKSLLDINKVVDLYKGTISKFIDFFNNVISDDTKKDKVKMFNKVLRFDNNYFTNKIIDGFEYYEILIKLKLEIFKNSSEKFDLKGFIKNLILFYKNDDNKKNIKNISSTIKILLDENHNNQSSEYKDILKEIFYNFTKDNIININIKYSIEIMIFIFNQFLNLFEKCKIYLEENQILEVYYEVCLILNFFREIILSGSLIFLYYNILNIHIE